MVWSRLKRDPFGLQTLTKQCCFKTWSTSKSQGLKSQFLLGNHPITNNRIFLASIFDSHCWQKKSHLGGLNDPTQHFSSTLSEVQIHEMSFCIPHQTYFYMQYNLQYLLLVLLPKIAGQGYEQNGCESTNTSSNL